jgi:hypothetical protein
MKNSTFSVNSHQPPATSQQPTAKLQLLKLVSLIVTLLFTHNLCFSQLVIQNATKTWSGLTQPQRDNARDNGIEIKDNGVLTIASGDVVKISMGKSIQIRSYSSGNGGILNVSGKIENYFDPTKNPPGGPIWAGIYILGLAPNTNGIHPSHYTKLPNVNKFNNQLEFRGVLNAQYGRVVLNVGAIIQNAYEGISSSDGGIIESYAGLGTSTGAVFKNCYTSIEIIDFKPPSSDKGASAFRLNNIKFTIDGGSQDPFPSLSSGGGYDLDKRNLVYLKNVTGVYFGGCTFESINQSNRCWDQRGKGIKAENAEFTVSEQGNVFYQDVTTGCTFVKVDGQTSSIFGGTFNSLTTAIEAISNTPFYTMEVNNAVFTNNLKSILSTYYHSVIRDCSITSNDLSLNSLFTSGGAYCATNTQSKRHIKLTNPGKTLIYNCSFQYDNSRKMSTPTYGVNPSIEIAGAQGYKILIKRNIIDGNNTSAYIAPYGILADGDLRGCLKISSVNCYELKTEV